MNTSADYAAWKDIPAWYLICKRDNAVKLDVQRAFVKEARDYLDQEGGAGTGEKNLKSEEIDTSHSPFLSRPEETAAFIEKAATTCGNRFKPHDLEKSGVEYSSICELDGFYSVDAMSSSSDRKVAAIFRPLEWLQFRKPLATSPQQ